MAIVVTEDHLSRELSKDSARLLYTVRGTASDTEARAALIDESPAYHNGLPRKNARVRPTFVDVTNGDASIWSGEVEYGTDARPETGESRYRFNTGGGTQHITQSLEVVGAYGVDPHGAPARISNIGGAIGGNGDTVEGADIIVRIWNWTETHYLADVYVTEAYRRVLFWLKGTLNQGSFRGFEPGEVLLADVDGGQREEEDWEITFSFAASPNMYDLIVGDITGIVVGGWQYLDVKYRKDPTSGVLRPRAAYVHRNYGYGDFTRLGIGR